MENTPVRVNKRRSGPKPQEAEQVEETVVTEQEIIPPPSWPELTEEEVTLVKSRTPGTDLYKFQNQYVPDQVYIIRPLRKSEWDAVRLGLLEKEKSTGVSPTNQEIDEATASIGVVWPVLPLGFFENGLAGTAISLAEQIRLRSGFPTVLADGSMMYDGVTLEMLASEEKEEIKEPEQEKIDSWIEASPTKSIGKIEFTDQGVLVLFRAVTRAEWNDVRLKVQSSNADFDLIVCERSVLWSNSTLDKMPAGVIEKLSQSVLEISAFNSNPTITRL